MRSDHCVLTLFLALILAFPLAAQETPSADDAGETPEAAAPMATAEDFEPLIEEWREIIVQLRKLQQEYRLARDTELRNIQAKYNVLIEEGEKLLPSLEAAAKAKLEQDPENASARDFIRKSAADALAKDDYARAYDILRSLRKSAPEDDSLLALEVVAAYGMDKFQESANKYKEIEEKELKPSERVELLGTTAADLIEKFAREQQLRKKEAEADDLPRVKLKTSAGDLVIELYENEAPNTVANFISLVEQGFYDGTPFHRVLEHFMAQGGDPTGEGSGGPGYRIACECHQDEIRHHFAGTLSMAHAGRDTGGSQFFLTFQATPFLDGKHTVFGRVIEGMEVLPKITRRDPEARTAAPPDRILEAEVLRKRDHDYEPKKL